MLTAKNAGVCRNPEIDDYLDAIKDGLRQVKKRVVDCADELVASFSLITEPTRSQQTISLVITDGAARNDDATRGNRRPRKSRQE